MENGIKLFTDNLKDIAHYLKDLKHGYPDYTHPRKIETLKIKVSAIKKHYELNGKEGLIDFSHFNKLFLTKLK